MTALVSRILQRPVEAKVPLIEQGLDSLGAAELLEELQLLGLAVDYEFLLGGATAENLIEVRRGPAGERPGQSDPRDPFDPLDLSGPQSLWAELDAEGWGAWANISLCLSMPASLIRAPFLPAIAQSLCDANEAMRMVLVREGEGGSPVRQQALPDFQIPIEIRDAPASDRDAMRLIEAFEGRESSPFGPSTRALILCSPDAGGRHWMCITMHHVFSDRISMHALAGQVRDMVAARRLLVADPPDVGYADAALWKNRRGSGAQGAENLRNLRAALARADVSSCRPVPRAAAQDWAIFAELPARAELGAAETSALERLSARLGTTLPLMVHALTSVLVAHLTGDRAALSGGEDLLLCHVVSNRDRDPALKRVVGCLDTSVPVAVGLSPSETLASLCRKTHEAFSAVHLAASDLPRGGWVVPAAGAGADGNHRTALVERFAHINIVRSPATDDRTAAADIVEHSVQRAQRTRWGLLLRVGLPPGGGSGSGPGAAAGAVFRAYAEDRVLSGLLPHCLVELLRAILSEPLGRVSDLPVRDAIAGVMDRADRAAAQVRRASALVGTRTLGDAFIYEKLVERQQRWYQHDERFRLRRDSRNRFLGTAANPFPFTQLDKLRERRFLEAYDVPLPKLLHTLPKDGIAPALVALAPELPQSFVIKPVGAGHSFGVTLVRDGADLTRGGVPFDPAVVGADLAAMAARGSCVHEGRVFPFNFSSFLIEDCVLDEKGFPAPTDYKVFMIGETFLWLQVHFREDGTNWVAFVDADFRLIPQPAWDPATCWRTHRTLVCTDQAMADARRPDCLSGILDHSRRLAVEMGIFVRLDWYADRLHGLLMGEITTFPHMLQPRGFYTQWANALVKSVWREPDGVAPPRHRQSDDPIEGALHLLDQGASADTGLEAFLPSDGRALWSVGTGVTYAELRDHVARFDLASWGVAPGARVGVLMANGVQLAATLLASMNRYVAVPMDAALPAARIAAQIREDGLRALVVLGGSDEARKLPGSAGRLPEIPVIELVSTGRFALAELPAGGAVPAPLRATPVNRLQDEVLLLRTSGTSGAAKRVGFTLDRLLRAGGAIGASLRLSPDDLGISMLPLHHVGGISCNLIAPLLGAAGMHHRQAFDPKALFDALAGPNGATWCYLVPAMWGMVLDYASAHPRLREERPWPRMRAIRSAGADLPVAMAGALADLFGDTVAILPTYGMTEAMPIAAPPPGYRLERPGSVGRVLPSMTVEIVDHTRPASLPPVADGEVGEITVRGPCVFFGYADAGGQESDVFTPRGFFRTGDLGRLAPDGSGWLRVEGRIRDMINAGGETIPPGEIEEILGAYPGWTGAGRRVEVMAFSRAHRTLGEDVALAVARAATDMDLSALCDWAAERLPMAKVPKTLVHLPELPRSGSGKPRRAQFATAFNAAAPLGEVGLFQSFTWDAGDAAPRLAATKGATPPRDMPGLDPEAVSLDAVLAVIRGHVAPGAAVGPDTVLADAGVNSLAAVELSLLLGERFHLDLPTWILSDAPTPRDLARAISRLKGTAPGARIPSDPDVKGAVPALPVRSRVRRMLFLHGEGADAELMDKSLRATRWTGRLSGRVEFVFLDAPHLCAPIPGFHSAAVEAGLYRKPHYRSWGVTQAETLRESLRAVARKLDEAEGIDAIGGICDGALVAALTALERPDLTLLVGMSPSPLSRLAGPWEVRCGPATCRSIHLVSGADAEHSLAQQLEITALCEAALIVQHDSGHAVPRFTEALERTLAQVLEADRAAAGGPAAPTPREPPRDAAAQARTRPARPVTDPAAYEPLVARHAARLLRLRRLERHRDFFEAGGDSLQAMVLAMKLEQKLGFDLPFEALFAEGATVEDMARAIALCRDTGTFGTMRPVGSSSASREIFALPILNGHHSAYRALARALSETARITGVKPPVLGRGAWTRCARLQDIAREAAAAISNHTDRGRVDLVGCSAAGVLALETARILDGWGYDIGCLALIDSDFTADKNRWPVPVKYLAEWQKHVSRRVRGKTNLRRGYRQVHFRAQLVDWKPEPVRIGSPIFFRAASGNIDERQIGMWREVIDGDLDVVDFAGKHDGFVLPEAARTIADAIRTRVSSQVV